MMADRFIGLQMVVTLKKPPNAQLKGTISAIGYDASASLYHSMTLSNVFALGPSQEWFPRLDIPTDNIADIVEANDNVPTPGSIANAAASPAPAAQVPVADDQYQYHPSQAATTQSQPLQPQFEDPAIVRVVVTGQPGSASRPSSGLRGQHKTIENPYGSQPSGGGGSLGIGVGQRQKTPDVSEAVNDLAVDDSPTPVRTAASEQVLEEQGQKKKKRKERRNATKAQAVDSADPADGSPARAPFPGNRGKGWRQTPILESTASFQPFNSLKRNGKGKKAAVNDNGWASEEVTEGMVEFNFEEGLAKFDKSTIFNQMRKQDQVDDADRLVSHNRLPKPGTAGGKNLHYSENVLETGAKQIPAPTTATDFWNSEADDGLNEEDEEEHGRREMRSSQSNNKRTDSRATVTRRSQSRKASAVAVGATTVAQPMSRVNSGVRATVGPGRGGSSGGRGAKKESTPRYTILKRTDKVTQQPILPQPGLFVLPANRRVESVSALQMLNLENIAANEIGLTEEMMTENAGRGLAEACLMALADPAIRVSMGVGKVTETTNNLAASATIAILAGNQKSGIRAVAAARHLRSKGANVLLCVVGIEREGDLFEDMRRQLRVYRGLGGRAFGKADFFAHQRKTAGGGGGGGATSTNQQPVQVTLIVDALLGLPMSFDELRTGDQASVYELIEWANRNEAFVLAVDVPTGIDPTSGRINVIDGDRLFIKPRYVVAMGAPKHGLVEAVAAASLTGPENGASGGGGVGGTAAGPGTVTVSAATVGTEPGTSQSLLADGDEWKLYIADMGLGPGVWKKAGTKIRKGIDFDDKWVLEMRYRGVGAGAPELHDDDD